jgi:hypothetical protein
MLQAGQSNAFLDVPSVNARRAGLPGRLPAVSGLGAGVGMAGSGWFFQWPAAWLVVVIFRIWPVPGGPPKPLTETYRLPSGPNVIAVGKFSPVVITVRWPFLILMISPVAGAGPPLWTDISRTYSAPSGPNARPSTVAGVRRRR